MYILYVYNIYIIYIHIYALNLCLKKTQSCHLYRSSKGKVKIDLKVKITYAFLTLKIYIHIDSFLCLRSTCFLDSLTIPPRYTE